MKPIKPSELLSRLPKQKRNPYTLPSEPTTHVAASAQKNCGSYMSKGGQSKRPTRASLGRRLNNLPRLTSSSESTISSMRSAPRPACDKNLQTTMPANKPRSKKSWHISGQGNIQITRITGRNSSGRNELGMQGREVPATGSVQPRTASTQLTLHFRSTPAAFSGEAELCPLFKNQDATPSDHESMTNIPLCDLNLCHACS